MTDVRECYRSARSEIGPLSGSGATEFHADRPENGPFPDKAPQSRQEPRSGPAVLQRRTRGRTATAVQPRTRDRPLATDFIGPEYTQNWTRFQDSYLASRCRDS